MSDKELIAEATAHIDNTLAGIGTDESSVRAAWARGEGSDDRFSLLVRLRDRLADALEAATSERDAALAAVDRVRAIHAPEVLGIHEGYGEEVWCPTCEHHYPCPTVAALDGAPEPEVKP